MDVLNKGGVVGTERLCFPWNDDKGASGLLACQHGGGLRNRQRRFNKVGGPYFFHGIQPLKDDEKPYVPEPNNREARGAFP
jgi:hypothetical protein